MPSTFGSRPTPARIRSTTTVLSIVVAEQIDPLPAVFGADPDGPRVQPHLDAVARKGSGQDLRGIALLPGQEQRKVLHDGRPGAQPTERLRQLAAERTTADHQQPARQLGQVEDVLVRQVVGVERGPGWTAISGREPVAIIAFSKRSLVPSTVNASVPAKRAPPRKTCTPAAVEPLDRNGSNRPLADPPHALHHGRKVDADVGRDLRAVAIGVPHLGVQARGANDGLRRHAAGVQAGAARSGRARRARPWRPGWWQRSPRRDPPARRRRSRGRRARRGADWARRTWAGHPASSSLAAGCALQPATAKAGPPQAVDDMRTSPHETPDQLRAVVLDHHHHDALIEPEVARRDPRAPVRARRGSD